MIPVFDGNRENLLELVSKMLYPIFVVKRFLSLVSIRDSLTKHTLEKEACTCLKKKNQLWVTATTQKHF